MLHISNSVRAVHDLGNADSLEILAQKLTQQLDTGSGMMLPKLLRSTFSVKRYYYGAGTNGWMNHGRIRATTVVALRWKHRSLYEAPGAQDNQGAAQKRPTNGAVASTGLHDSQAPPWSPGKKQVDHNPG